MFSRTMWTGYLSCAIYTTSDARTVCFFQAEDGIRGIGVTGVQTCALPISNRDHVSGLQYGRGDVVLAAVELEVPVHDELARLRPARGEAHPVDDVVHPELHEPKQVLAGDALHPGGPVVGPPELLL